MVGSLSVWQLSLEGEDSGTGRKGPSLTLLSPLLKQSKLCVV